MGMALYPQDGESFEVLYGKADLAMYQAKKLGRNQYIFYLPSMAAVAHQQ
ncbi:MAG: diguanylate cyclase [Clostridiales bacterium]